MNGGAHSPVPLRSGRLVKRSFSIAGHRTSVALEQEFWAALSDIAAARGRSLSALVEVADAAREPGQPLASALRILALREIAGSASARCR